MGILFGSIHDQGHRKRSPDCDDSIQRVLPAGLGVSPLCPLGGPTCDASVDATFNWLIGTKIVVSVLAES